MATNLINQASESSQWLQWGNYHRQMFGWKQDSDVEMIALWIGTFRRWGFTPSEMYAATDSILKRPVPAYKREDHINYIYSCVHEKRLSKRNANCVEDYSRGQCAMCFNSGLVTVPLLRDVEKKEWVSNKTCGVWCSCYDGRNYSCVKTEDGRKLMGIVEYTARNPDWKTQTGERRAVNFEIDYLTSEVRNKNTLEDHKSKFDVIRDRIAIRFGLLPEAL